MIYKACCWRLNDGCDDFGDIDDAEEVYASSPEDAACIFLLRCHEDDTPIGEGDEIIDIWCPDNTHIQFEVTYGRVMQYKAKRVEGAT